MCEHVCEYVEEKEGFLLALSLIEMIFLSTKYLFRFFLLKFTFILIESRVFIIEILHFLPPSARRRHIAPLTVNIHNF